ncbi:hypothetical protein Q7P36_006173 [Cladosporium allicinum]
MSSTTTTTATSPLPATLTDPTLKTTQTPPAYPLETNNLSNIVKLKPAFAGQWSMISLRNQPAGSHLCNITTHTPCPIATWSSVQTSKTTHIELNSALVYMNHSCSPTVEIEVFAPGGDGVYEGGIAGEVRVAKGRDLREGEGLTFFYPSTEWISPRPFGCLCGAGEGVCIGMQRGARFVDAGTLGRHYLNAHVVELLAERDGEDGGTKSGS